MTPEERGRALCDAIKARLPDALRYGELVDGKRGASFCCCDLASTAIREALVESQVGYLRAVSEPIDSAVAEATAPLEATIARMTAAAHRLGEEVVRLAKVGRDIQRERDEARAELADARAHEVHGD